MSHAPPRRKSAQAVAKAASNVAAAAAAAREARKRSTPAPAPHQVVLRVKRKRSDAAVDNLLVATTDNTNGLAPPDRKRRETIEETLADLSLNRRTDGTASAGNTEIPASQPKPQRLFFKRVRTTEWDGSRRNNQAPALAKVISFENGSAGAKATEREGETVQRRVGGRLDIQCKDGVHKPPLVSHNVLDYLEVRRVKAKGVPSARMEVGDSAELAALGDGDPVPLSGDMGTAPPITRNDFHVIDLHPVAKDVDREDAGDALGGGGKGNGIDVPTTVRGSAQAAPVLNPVERQMDEAIYEAFQTGNLAGIRRIVAASPSSTIINYQRRLGDGTTALMAAAFRGDLDTVRNLLSLGAKASLVDSGEKSAALLAGMRGHRECFAELQRTADEEIAQSSSRKGGGAVGFERGSGDFVYDLYYFEPAAGLEARGGSERVEPRNGKGGVAGHGQSEGWAGDAPVVRLSGIGPVDANAVGAIGVAELELEFEHDSDWSELGDGNDGEDPDSNSEGYYGNDYPEEEDGENGTAAPYLYSGSSYESENGSSSDDPLSSDESDEDNDKHRRTLRSVYGNIDRNPADHDSVYFQQRGFAGNFSLDAHGTGGVGAESFAPRLALDGAGLASGGASGLGKADVFAWDPVRASGGQSGKGGTFRRYEDDDIMGRDADSGSGDVGEDWL